MNTAYDMYHMHDLHWQKRKEWGDLFPVPSKRHTGFYILQELGEFLDGVVRGENTGHTRNTEKAIAPEDELADLWLMLDTALGPDFDVSRVPVLKFAADQLDFLPPTDYASEVVWGVIQAYTSGDVYRAMASVAAYPTFNLRFRVGMALDRWNERAVQREAKRAISAALAAGADPHVLSDHLWDNWPAQHEVETHGDNGLREVIE